MGNSVKPTCRTNAIFYKASTVNLQGIYNVFNFPDEIQDQESNIVKKQGLIYILSGCVFIHAAI